MVATACDRCARTAGRSDERTLLELPVTTLPGLQVPIHVSYLLMLVGVLARSRPALYFDAALRLCRLAGVEPSILLHPLDLLSGDDVAGPAFFPGMQIRRRREAGAGRSRTSTCSAPSSGCVPVGEHARARARDSIAADPHAEVRRMSDRGRGVRDPGRTPLVSVIVPAFNEADVIVDTLDTPRRAPARRSNARFRWEIVVVDDGSTDTTGELAEAFAADARRVRVLRHRVNFRLGQALRYAFGQTHGRLRRGDRLRPQLLARSHHPHAARRSRTPARAS